MEIRFRSISLTRYTALIVAQLVVNVSLAAWLYNEYLHNPFMQSYVSNVWAVIWPEVTGSTVVAGALLAFFISRRASILGLTSETGNHTIQATGISDSLTPIDACPFCEVPLKKISEGRLQCRNCRRYFKSSMPKVLA